LPAQHRVGFHSASLDFAPRPGLSGTSCVINLQKKISGEFERGFQGMTEEPVTLDELLAARETLIAEIVGNMPDEHRRFLSVATSRVGRYCTPAGRALAKQNLNKLDRGARNALVTQLEAQ
jgi:hypothetical protein